MAVYSIEAVRAGIYSIISGIASIQSVYNYPNPIIIGYPAIIFDLSQEDATTLDTRTNTRVMSWTIWIACEVPVEGLQAATATLDRVSDDVINALEKITNQSLGGACDWMMPVFGKRQQAASPEGTFVYQELDLKVYLASDLS